MEVTSTKRNLESLNLASPVSVVVANLYMEDFETRVMATCGYGIKFWVRKEDVFCIVKKDRVVIQ